MSAGKITQGGWRRQSLVSRGALRVIVHGRPEGRAVESWLGSLGQLRSPAALDRAILDSVHKDLGRNPRAQPVLILSVTLCCVVFGGVVKFYPGELAIGPTLAKSPEADKSPAGVETATALAPLVPPETLPRSPAASPAANQTPLLAVVRPSDSHQSQVKAKAALAARGFTTTIRTPTMVRAVQPLRLAGVTPQPLTEIPLVTMHSETTRTGVGVLPISQAPAAGTPPIPVTNALAWSGADMAAAPIKLHERVNGMVNPGGLFASLPQARDSGYRPIYKRPWFVGMLGVAATGLAVGVTAAVVSSQQASHGMSGQPIRISLGPT